MAWVFARQRTKPRGPGNSKGPCPALPSACFSLQLAGGQLQPRTYNCHSLMRRILHTDSCGNIIHHGNLVLGCKLPYTWLIQGLDSAETFLCLLSNLTVLFGVSPSVHELRTASSQKEVIHQVVYRKTSHSLAWQTYTHRCNNLVNTSQLCLRVRMHTVIRREN